MFKLFFLIAIRNFIKSKLFFFINVFGLGISLACAIVGYLNYRFEMDLNSWHVNKDKIYIVNIKKQINERKQKYAFTPITLAPTIQDKIGKTDLLVRYTNSNSPIRYDKGKEPKIFNQRIAYADKDFFNMFTFPLKSGNISSFADKSKIILSEKTAEKFFGNSNPLGEIVTIFNDKGIGSQFIVGGIIKELPRNYSIMDFDAITLIDNFISMFEVKEFNWKSWVDGTFILTENPSVINNLDNELKKIVSIQNTNNEAWKIAEFFIQSLEDFTRDSRNIWANGIGANMHPAQVIGTNVMAILILLLACFNFMNTAIAISNKRIKEIGIRKVLGSMKKNIVFQFLGENFLICFAAILLSLILSLFLIAEYNVLWSYIELKLSFVNNFKLWMFLFVLLIFTGIAAGAYPAFYISKFNPIQVLKGRQKFRGAGFFSKFLLILQFSIALVGLISSILFTQNAVFQEKFNLGYNKETIITIPCSSTTNLELIRNAIQNNPDITDIAVTNNQIAWGTYNRTVQFIDTKTETQIMNVGLNFCRIMELKLLNGRDFLPEFEKSDINKSVIINELFAKELKITEPLGKKIKIDTLDLTIVGVMKDFYFYFWVPLKPLVLKSVNKEASTQLIVKTANNKVNEVDKMIKSEWEKNIPNAPYQGTLQNRVLDESKSINSSITKMNIFLAFVSIVLSLIALYTLVSLNIIKRTKEIGIRKVLGASSFHINFLITKPFILILLIASIVGSVSGYMLNYSLISSIWPIHADINYISILIPVIIMLFVAICTISTKVYITLSKNPVDSLRYE